MNTPIDVPTHTSTTPPMPEDSGYSMKAVARMTGLTPHAIRVWEKRYGAVTPSRTETNRRLYTGEEVERLRLLRRATQEGHSIGRIAHLPNDRLAALISGTAPPPAAPVSPEGRAEPEEYLNRCLQAALDLDTDALASALHQASASMSRFALMEEVVMPLMERIGDRWREGALRVSHEHLTSSVVRSFLGSLNGMHPSESAPRLVVATPAGQLHELGALVAAVTAAADGWRVAYLGPNLPAEEIAGAARQSGARAVALSIVYPGDDPYLGGELVKLRRSLPEGVAILAGGRSSPDYEPTLQKIGAHYIADFREFRASLEGFRRLPNAERPSASES